MGFPLNSSTFCNCDSEIESSYSRSYSRKSVLPVILMRWSVLSLLTFSLSSGLKGSIIGESCHIFGKCFLTLLCFAQLWQNPLEWHRFQLSPVWICILQEKGEFPLQEKAASRGRTSTVGFRCWATHGRSWFFCLVFTVGFFYSIAVAGNRRPCQLLYLFIYLLFVFLILHGEVLPSDLKWGCCLI